MAHRPLIEVDDAAGPQRSHVIYPDDDLLADGLDEGVFRLRAKLDSTEFLAQARLDGGRPDRGVIALAGSRLRAALLFAWFERIVHGCRANDRFPGSGVVDSA